MAEGVGHGKRYTREFKLEAAKLVVEGGYTQTRAATRLGVSIWSIRDWVRGFRKSGELPTADRPAPLAEELKALRREVSELRLENAILKKAAAYFAKESL